MVCKVRKEESACVIGWILTARPGKTVSRVQQSTEFHPKDFRFRDGDITVMTIEAQVKIGLVIGIGRSRGGNIIGKRSRRQHLVYRTMRIDGSAIPMAAGAGLTRAKTGEFCAGCVVPVRAVAESAVPA